MAMNRGLMDFAMKDLYKGKTESLPFYNMQGYSDFTGSPVDDYNIGQGMQGRRSEDDMWDREWDYSQENYDNPERADGRGVRQLDLWDRDRVTPYAGNQKTTKIWEDAPESDFNSQVLGLHSGNFNQNPYWESDEEYPGQGLEAQYAGDLEDLRTKGYSGSRSPVQKGLIEDYFRNALSGRGQIHQTAPSGAFGQWSGYGSSGADENRMARYQEELDY
jgi:hypothetical protein